MGSGGFPIDLLLFGMIAAFLVLRLRGILGRKTGFERPAQPEEIALAYVFRASLQCSSYITGEILPIVGGY